MADKETHSGLSGQSPKDTSIMRRNDPIIYILLFIMIATIVLWCSRLRNSELSTGRGRQPELQNFVVDNGHIEAKLQNLPSLELISWPEVEFLPVPMGAPGSHQPLLGVQFSRGQMRTLWKLFSTFMNAMEELGLSDRWMLYSGTLLGSFRHHDIVPWDDDMDVLVDLEVRTALREKIRKMSPDIFIFEDAKRDKIYAKLIEPSNSSEDMYGSRKLSAYGWGWPYLDVSYYSSNETHIREIKGSRGQFDIYAKADVFPLLLRPFFKYWVPTPRNTFTILLQTFPKHDLCSSLFYSHAFEHKTDSQAVPCNELGDKFPFVEHAPLYDKVLNRHGSQNDLDLVRERLVLGSKTIHEIHLLAPRQECNVQTYRLKAK